MSNLPVTLPLESPPRYKESTGFKINTGIILELTIDPSANNVTNYMEAIESTNTILTRKPLKSPRILPHLLKIFHNLVSEYPLCTVVKKLVKCKACLLTDTIINFCSQILLDGNSNLTT